MEIPSIEAQSRETGKKAARKIRREGNVPCILYSRNTDPVPFQMPALAVKRLAYAREAGTVEVEVNGESWNCILKDLDLDPITDEPIHADFQVLESGERIRLTVPIHFEGIPVGQSEGGDTQYILNQVQISCLPQDIPSHIEVDVSDLQIGESLHIYDLEVEGVEFEMSPEQTVVTVVAPYVEPTVTEEVEEEALEVELTEEGEVVDTAEAEEGVGEGQPPEEEDEDFEEEL